MSEVFLKRYKIAAPQNSMYLQVPPSFVEAKRLKKGQRMFVYSSKGQLIFRATERPRHGRVLLGVYNVQKSGYTGLRVLIPQAFRDQEELTADDHFEAMSNEHGELIYKKEQ